MGNLTHRQAAMKAMQSVLGRERGMDACVSPAPLAAHEVRSQMLLDWGDPRRHAMNGDDAVRRLPPRPSSVAHAMVGPWESAGSKPLWRIGTACAEGNRSEQDGQGNRFLHLKGGGTVVLRPCDAAMAPPRNGTTMPRPVSLGEVLGWSEARRKGLTLPCALHCGSSQWPTSGPGGCSVLSASPAERFVLRHGDNYGHVELRRPDGTWEPVATAADYMPAGAGRRYLREVGKLYGEFQRCHGGSWTSEREHGRQLRLYLIDGRFEMLTDEQYVLRHGGQARAWSSRPLHR